MKQGVDLPLLCLQARSELPLFKARSAEDGKAAERLAENSTEREVFQSLTSGRDIIMSSLID